MSFRLDIVDPGDSGFELRRRHWITQLNQRAIRTLPHIDRVGKFLLVRFKGISVADGLPRKAGDFNELGFSALETNVHNDSTVSLMPSAREVNRNPGSNSLNRRLS